MHVTVFSVVLCLPAVNSTFCHDEQCLEQLSNDKSTNSIAAHRRRSLHLCLTFKGANVTWNCSSRALTFCKCLSEHSAASQQGLHFTCSCQHCLLFGAHTVTCIYIHVHVIYNEGFSADAGQIDQAMPHRQSQKKRRSAARAERWWAQLRLFQLAAVDQTQRLWQVRFHQPFSRNQEKIFAGGYSSSFF